MYVTIIDKYREEGLMFYSNINIKILVFVYKKITKTSLFELNSVIQLNF